jgi:hypothetical protein
MPAPIPHRMTVDFEGDFVVFLIGMKIHKPLKLRQWLPAAKAMPRMLRELSQRPECGFLGFQILGGLPPVVLQFWRSFEQLEAYAKDRSGAHYPAWKAFNEKLRDNQVVGIWHETYKVHARDYECVYHNMPPYGFGKVGKLVSATGRRQSARGRINLNSTEGPESAGDAD